MADATGRANVKTPLPQRDDLQKLIPDNVRLRRALEQLFIDVSTTIPAAIQDVGDNSQAVTEDVSMGVFGATSRDNARTQTALGDALGRSSEAAMKRLAARVADLESQTGALQPVRPRVEGFIAPTLINAWANFGAPYNPAGYYKDPFGIVHLRGIVTGGAVGTVAFVLPAKYRPANKEQFVTTSNAAFAYVNVDAAGNVTMTAGVGPDFSIDGMTFRAA